MSSATSSNRDTLTMTITATLAGAISMLANFGFYFGGGNRNSDGIGPIGGADAGDPRAARRRARADRRSAAGANTRRTASAPRSAASRCRSPLPCARFPAPRSRFPILRPSAIQRRRISSSSTRCPARAWTISSPPTPMWRTASPSSMRSPRAWARAPAYSLCRLPQALAPRGRGRAPQASGYRQRGPWDQS